MSVLREIYHEAFRIVIDTILETLERLERCAASSADAADPRVRAAAEAIHNLRFAPPKTTYEVLMFQLLYFYFGEHVDNLQVRTLGNVDRLWTPYYRADLAAGRLTEAQFREMLAHFWWQWGSIDNYWGQSVYIGGTKADGTTEYDEVSRLVLDVHDELALPTPKLQLKIADNTPEWVWEKALDMSRRHRSLVYCGEEPMRRAMRTMGFTDEEARTADIWGCYEFQPRATANTTLPVILNAVSPVADLLKRAAEGGFAAPSFEAFRDAYLAELARRTDVVRDLSFEYEKHMDEFIPSLVHSLTIDSCVTAGRNAVGNGMKYNLTVLLLCGMGTAADALLGVKEIVYERRLMSLADLGRLMAVNWKGQEALRLERSRSRRKWGNGDAEACQLADAILKTFGGRVNGRPNSRGGRFYAGGHSIDYYRHFGYALGATPDGRQKGDEISKNLSPTPGADREGATALVGDFGRLDVARDVPGDTPCDMWMHPATIHGEAGLVAMKALVRVYHANGGVAIHFNVLSSEELRDAQAHPERYENLQVRVCGWNVRWNDLSRHEQDSFIRRAEAVAQ